MRVLVTGATGYIGGRLVPELLSAGHEVRCLARSPQKLRDYPWRTQVTVAQGDVLDPARLDTALDGVEVAYYLVHAMGTGASFARRDREAAKTFSAAAERAGLTRIIYLGGLNSRDQELSEHLRSRAEVGGWGVSPFHGVVFGSMARNIAAAAGRPGVHGGRGGDS